MSMPNSTISFHGNNADMLLDDSITTGSRKRKPTFSMNDPDNAELARLATQAAKKKAKLSKNNPSEKKTTNQKKTGPKNRQPSVEEEDEIFPPRRAGIPRNPKNIIESSDDDDDGKAPTPAPSQNKKMNRNLKSVPKLGQTRNRQPSVEDVDDENKSGNDDDTEDSDMVVIVEKPAESAEEELSKLISITKL
jgi:hypothetical protein